MSKKRTAKDRFRAFLDDFGKTAPNTLPLVHTTSCYSFADMCEGDNIDPSWCEHFEKDLIYLFYGRPAYRTETGEFSNLSFSWPIVFVFDPSKITDITSVYPFDTGAFFLELYRRFFSRNSEIDDFLLPGDLESAKKLVGTFYRDDDEYLDGRSGENVEIPPMSFEAEGVQRLSQEPSYTARLAEDQVTRDERSSSIEVQTETPIDIPDATLALIVPNPYLEITEVTEAIDRWNLKEDQVHFYEVQGFHEDTSWMGQIYLIVKSIYKKNGFLR